MPAAGATLQLPFEQVRYRFNVDLSAGAPDPEVRAVFLHKEIDECGGSDRAEIDKALASASPLDPTPVREGRGFRKDRRSYAVVASNLERPFSLVIQVTAEGRQRNCKTFGFPELYSSNLRYPLRLGPEQAHDIEIEVDHGRFRDVLGDASEAKLVIDHDSYVLNKDNGWKTQVNLRRRLDDEVDVSIEQPGFVDPFGGSPVTVKELQEKNGKPITLEPETRSFNALEFEVTLRIEGDEKRTALCDLTVSYVDSTGQTQKKAANPTQTKVRTLGGVDLAKMSPLKLSVAPGICREIKNREVDVSAPVDGTPYPVKASLNKPILLAYLGLGDRFDEAHERNSRKMKGEAIELIIKEVQESSGSQKWGTSYLFGTDRSDTTKKIGGGPNNRGPLTRSLVPNSTETLRKLERLDGRGENPANVLSSARDFLNSFRRTNDGPVPLATIVYAYTPVSAVAYSCNEFAEIYRDYFEGSDVHVVIFIAAPERQVDIENADLGYKSIQAETGSTAILSCPKNETGENIDVILIGKDEAKYEDDGWNNALRKVAETVLGGV